MSDMLIESHGIYWAHSGAKCTLIHVAISVVAVYDNMNCIAMCTIFHGATL